jgi:hypothetical protein
MKTKFWSIWSIWLWFVFWLWHHWYAFFAHVLILICIFCMVFWYRDCDVANITPCKFCIITTKYMIKHNNTCQMGGGVAQNSHKVLNIRDDWGWDLTLFQWYALIVKWFCNQIEFSFAIGQKYWETAWNMTLKNTLKRMMDGINLYAFAQGILS